MSRREARALLAAGEAVPPTTRRNRLAQFVLPPAMQPGDCGNIEKKEDLVSQPASLNDQHPPDQQEVQRERWELVEHISALIDKPMIALSFVWLGLLILDFTTGLSPALRATNTVIWVLFWLDFLLKLVIAPDKRRYLQHNWLTAFSLLLPALRMLRILRPLQLLRASRATRSISLVRLLTSLNRGMRAMGKTFERRGVGYVVALSILITFGGAAGMVVFESPAALRAAGYEEVVRNGGGLASYGEAVWWTAMTVTTVGPEYWPKTVEGRVLSLLLSIYAFAVFGYVTAAIASYFIDQDRRDPRGGGREAQEIAGLRTEIAALREQLARLEGPREPSVRGAPEDVGAHSVRAGE